MKLNVLQKGQVFTPKNIVSYMISLIKNDGATLEPSCGNGAFLSNLPLHKTIAIEKQSNLCNYNHLNMDFFDYQTLTKFKTIIGNPPYVKHKDIMPNTKKKLDYSIFDKRTNLYLFFISKCIDLLDDNGELIFITPRDFLKQTSAAKLNEQLFELGSFTHLKDFGDQALFNKYTPNCLIWRWQKGLKTYKLDDGRYINCLHGQIVFDKNKNNKKLGNIFDIKVGAVSGADYIFTQNTSKSIYFVCSTTCKNGTLRKMLYNTYHDILLKYKKPLMNRKIKKFGDANWWQWGRKYAHRKGERIYVNCKTRNNTPFFISDIPAYDGSILALFPKKKQNLNSLCSSLNSLDWDKLGFKCGGRYIYSQRSLENLPVDL